MYRDFKLFLLVVGLPALLLASVGIYLVQLEKSRTADDLTPANAVQTTLESAATDVDLAAPEPQHRVHGRPNGFRPPPAFGQKRYPPRPGFGQRISQTFRNMPEWSVEVERDVAQERVFLIGACVVGLLFLLLLSGLILLARSVRVAREEVKRKDRFIANISDEFKTPLTTICLCADLAQEEELPAEKRREMLSAIQSEAARLKAIVQAEDFPLGWSEKKA